MKESAGEIVRAHGGMVWRTVCRLVGTGYEADAADCFQEVFVAALEVGRKDEVQNWEAMLKRIATTKGLTVLRARIRTRGRMQGGIVLEDVVGAAGPVSAGMEQAELAGALRVALAEIPADQAELFCLRHVEGMSYEAIGEQMAMSAGAVGVAIHRSKERLRELLGERASKTRGVL